MKEPKEKMLLAHSMRVKSLPPTYLQYVKHSAASPLSFYLSRHPLQNMIPNLNTAHHEDQGETKDVLNRHFSMFLSPNQNLAKKYDNEFQLIFGHK